MKLAFYLFILSFAVWGQVETVINPVDFEQNPPHLEWKKIDTKNFELIFPSEVESQAQRLAHLLEKAYPFVSRSLETLPPKISIVLQNQSTLSNGFVTLAPRRSEFFATPTIDPELSNTEWLKTLAIHELRHVVQFEKAKQGSTKYFYFFLGEVGHALGLAFSMPPWFLEGDAVGLETALTNGGRGRVPLFERDLRTLLLSGKDFSFDKAHMRSYEDWVPNHYVYGYFLTSFLRGEGGDLALSNITNLSTRRAYNPLSFYNAVEENLGKRFEAFYQTTMKELIQNWQKKLDEIAPTPFEVTTYNKRFGWTNYSFPQLNSQGKLFALKHGLSFIDQMVKIHGKKEETIFYLGPRPSEHPLKIRGNRVAWSEIDIDPRWGYRDFQRVRVYDLEKDKITLELSQNKNRIAVLNHNGSKILLVGWSEKQEQTLEVVNLKGESLTKRDFPSSEVITSADWLNEIELVLVTKDHQDQKGVVIFSLDTGKAQELVPKSTTTLGFVAVEEGKILIESPASGIDNIYLFENGRLIQLTSSRYGAYAPILRNGKLIYNDYTVDGMNVVEKILPWDEEKKSQDSFVPVYDKFAHAEGADSLAAELSESSLYDVGKYSQAVHAFNLHSWFILAPPLSNTITLAGYSRDILNKFSLSAGGEFNLNENTPRGFVSLAWSHWYPVLDLRATHGNRRQNLRRGGQESTDRWEEGTAELGLQVPWRHIKGRFTQIFTLRAFTKLIKVTGKMSNDPTEISNGALLSRGAEASYSILSRLAIRDINPAWGLFLDAHLEEGKDITGDDQEGFQFSARAKGYLPGLWHHHSFFHELSFERQRDRAYQYASFILYPRGTRSIFLQEMVKYSANYTLPLFYPDFNLSRYFYLKRVMLNGFYDELKGRDGSLDYHAASAGYEVLFETFIARLLFPITWGLRSSYPMTGLERSQNYEVFLATTLGSFQ
jgi:hypothetical protein